MPYGRRAVGSGRDVGSFTMRPRQKLSDDVADMRGMQKAMVWIVGGLGSLGFVGKVLHWF